MTQLKKSFINCDTNKNVSSMYRGKDNDYNNSSNDEYIYEPSGMISEEYITPKFKNTDVNENKIHIKIQKDSKAQNTKVESRKNEKSFIKNMVKKVEDIYKNRLYNKKNNKLLYNSGSVKFLNEYLNVEPTNNVLYNRRSPNETLLKSDFNRINLKPFFRFKSVGNLYNPRKNKAIIKISNLNPSLKYDNNNDIIKPKFFYPGSSSIPQYRGDANLKKIGFYKNNMRFSNDINYLNNRANTIEFPDNRNVPCIRRNNTHAFFNGKNTKNIKYNDPYLRSCNSYNLKKHCDSHNKRNKICMKISNNIGNEEENLDDSSNDVNNNSRLPYCSHNINNFKYKITKNNDFHNQQKNLRSRISVPLNSYNSNLRKNDESIFNSNSNNNNYIKIKQNTNGINICCENNMNRKFSQNQNNCNNINDYSCNNKYLNRNFSSDIKNSQNLINENYINDCNNLKRNDVNLKYLYNDKNSSYSENNKSNSKYSSRFKEKKNSASMSNLRKNEILSNEDRTSNLSEDDKNRNNKINECDEESFNQDIKNKLYKSPINSIKQLKDGSYKIDSNMVNGKYNKSNLQIEDKRNSLSSFDNNISDMKMIKRNFSNKTKSSNNRIVLYDNDTKFRNKYNDIDYRIIKDNNSKDAIKKSLSDIRYLNENNCTDSNSEDSIICNKSKNSKDKYGNLKTMTIISDSKRIQERESENMKNPIKNINSNSKKYVFSKKSQNNDLQYHSNSSERNSENWKIMKYSANNKYKFANENCNMDNYKKYKISSHSSKKNKRDSYESKRSKANKIKYDGLLVIEDKKSKEKINSSTYQNRYNNSNDEIYYSPQKIKTKSSYRFILNEPIVLKDKESSRNKSNGNEDDGNFSSIEKDKKYIYTNRNSGDNTSSMKKKKNLQ